MFTKLHTCIRVGAWQVLKVPLDGDVGKAGWYKPRAIRLADATAIAIIPPSTKAAAMSMADTKGEANMNDATRRTGKTQGMYISSMQCPEDQTRLTLHQKSYFSRLMCSQCGKRRGRLLMCKRCGVELCNEIGTSKPCPIVHIDCACIVMPPRPDEVHMITFSCYVFTTPMSS